MFLKMIYILKKPNEEMTLKCNSNILTQKKAERYKYTAAWFFLEILSNLDLGATLGARILAPKSRLLLNGGLFRAIN